MQNEKKGEIDMKCNLWDVNQENTCGYCVHARVLMDGDKVVCKKKNNMFAFSDTCKKFTFDILKKNLRRRKTPDFSGFNKSDFEL